MSDLREDIDNAVEYHSVGGREWLVSDEVFAAARRFLALTETGPDYEAAVREKWRQLKERGEIDFVAVMAIVDAALADYLTEEET